LVLADPGQIEQVILNLALNSRDAMPQGGKLTIETGNVELDAEYADRHLEVQPGPFVLLAVSDTGTGLTEESRERIFEPFFTTKEQGKGTGLGLSVVYGIVKQSGGHIWVYSEPGQGSTFKIYLPRISQVPEPESLSVLPASQGRGAETILVVEDEELVRQVTCKMLEMKGYKVMEAASGPAASALSEQHRGAIQLLLTDVLMPEMSGKDLAQHLALRRPEIKVLFMSGHTENAIVHHGVLTPGIAFIQKPFRLETLVHKVREVLDAS
jgi:CheY-like chemotaxis protein